MMSRIETRRLFPPPPSSSSILLSRRVFHLQENSLHFRVLLKEHRKISRATIGGRCCFTISSRMWYKKVQQKIWFTLYTYLLEAAKLTTRRFPHIFFHFKAATCDPPLPSFCFFSLYFSLAPKIHRKRRAGREEEKDRKQKSHRCLHFRLFDWGEVQRSNAPFFSPSRRPIANPRFSHSRKKYPTFLPNKGKIES